MEILSEYELKKYDHIIEQINSEFEKCESLKQQISNENDQIIALKLVSAPSNQISHVNVKIFNSLCEIQNLYGDELKHVNFKNYLNKFNNHKFYLVEVYLPNTLLQKLLISKWKLQVNVECGEYSVNKVCILNNNTPTYDVIPIRSDIRECTVNTCLFLPTEDAWTVIDLNSVEVDISYHFESQKDVKNKFNNLNESLFRLSDLYNKSSSDHPYSIELKGVPLCNIDSTEQFIKTILKNTYHKFSLTKASRILEGKELQLYSFDGKIQLFYDCCSKALSMNCNNREAALVKRFFVKHATFDPVVITGKLKKLIARKRQLNTDSVQDIFRLYEETRKLWLT